MVVTVTAKLPAEFDPNQYRSGIDGESIDWFQRRLLLILVNNDAPPLAIIFISKEGAMRALDVVRGVFVELTTLIIRSRQGSDFVCGECERWERCGLPPSNRCIVMVAQIARNGGRPAKRAGLPSVLQSY